MGFVFFAKQFIFLTYAGLLCIIKIAMQFRWGVLCRIIRSHSANFIRQQVQEGDFCIDATMGNGNDTLLLSQLCGTSGKVLAFDIQEQALKATKNRLTSENAPENYTLLLESHSNMSEYARPYSISCIVFNFVYLPGGDHALATRGETSIQALTQSLSLLKKGGMISLCIYSGGDSGFE